MVGRREERRVVIELPGATVTGVLFRSSVADAIWEALPLSGSGNLWGDEFYFPIPVAAEADSPVEVVEPGDIAYWPSGHCLCIFWGPTPASRGKECRPASAVEVVGRVDGDLAALKKVMAGRVDVTGAG